MFSILTPADWHHIIQAGTFVIGICVLVAAAGIVQRALDRRHTPVAKDDNAQTFPDQEGSFVHPHDRNAG